MIFDIETSGLEPLENVISCISIIKNNSITTFFGSDEKQILKDFWNYVDDFEELIGFNISNFDIPFLIKRSIINNIRIKKIGKIIDLRLLVNGFFYSYDKKINGSLDKWAKILGLEVKENDGLFMVECYNKKDFETIKSHCEYDVFLTKKLYERCKECNLL